MNLRRFVVATACSLAWLAGVGLSTLGGSGCTRCPPDCDVEEMVDGTYVVDQEASYLDDSFGPTVVLESLVVQVSSRAEVVTLEYVDRNGRPEAAVYERKRLDCAP